MIKSFRPIVLLNTLGKLIEKVIGERLQFLVVNNDFIYLSQLGGLKFKLTIDAGAVLIHIIHLGWSRNCLTSTLALDIIQFFPFLNHCFLTKIIHKAGLDNWVVNFFGNYLNDRKTSYKWNSFLSPIINMSRLRIHSLSDFIYSLSFSFLIYSRKMSKKSKNPHFYHLFCK